MPRGRPRKIKEVEVEQQIDTPKKRGRPKKIVDPNSEEIIKKVKGKPGRPKKIKENIEIPKLSFPTNKKSNRGKDINTIFNNGNIVNNSCQNPPRWFKKTCWECFYQDKCTSTLKFNYVRK